MNHRERQDLDRHITGNYGEDQLREEPVHTHREPYAYWTAWRGDYDLGCRLGYGQTEEEAIAALLEQEEERNA